MKTTLLAQNDNVQIEDLKANVGKSVEPLSHSVTFPIDVQGQIYPICCVETVPSDSFQIANEVLLRQLQPLKVPVMTKFTLNTAYFYCSNRLAWKKWSMFADQANKGRADVNYSFELPRLANNFVTRQDESNKFVLFDQDDVLKIDYSNSIHSYLGISMGLFRKTNTIKIHDSTVLVDNLDIEDDLPLAFPAFDYQLICRDFYTNIDRIDDNPDMTHFADYDNPFADWAFSNLYPVDDDEIRLRDGIQYKSGFNSGDDSESNKTVGFILDKLRYHDLRPDYFNSSKRAPMRGEAPTVDTTVAVSGVDASDLVYANKDAEDFQQLNSVALYTENNETRMVSGPQSVQEVLGENLVVTKAQSTSTTHLLNALNKLKVNLSTTKAINAAELRLLSQLTVWQELNMLHKPYYNDFLNAHFDGIKVGDSLAEAPQYIGGTSQVININEVLQTSESTNNSPLGSQAAVAHSLAGSEVGKFFSPDFGFIIGVAYIIPDIVYEPALPRWANRRAIEDYYFPEFANLSMQATLNKELFFSNDNDWNNQALGYVGAYDELRSIPNKIAGDLLNDSYTDLKSWVLRRTFTNSNKPAINQRYLSAKGNVEMTAWTVPNAPKFMLQCANYIKSVRPMPSIAVPKAL